MGGKDGEAQQHPEGEGRADLPARLEQDDSERSPRSPGNARKHGPGARLEPNPSPELTPRTLAPALPADFAARLERGIDTEWGGILFLINLMLELDLPASFEEGWGLASEAGPWGLLDALGRSLLSLDGITHTADPLWAALAHLEDRDPRERIGERVRWPDGFCIPPGWLDRLAPGAVAYTRADSRLVGWSEHGFLLFDQPEAEPQSLLARAALAESSPVWPVPTGHLMEPVAPALIAWLVRALPFLRTRLARSLRLQPGERLTSALLRIRARLYISRSHVDLVMRQDSASLRVRLAGWDRDPGWLRPFGRVVLFHFK